MTGERISSLLARADCRQLFRELFPEHHRAEGNSLCVWHPDKTPSLQVSEHLVFCHGCGIKLDALDLIERGTGCSTAEAIQILSSRCAQAGGNGGSGDDAEAVSHSAAPEKEKKSTDFSSVYQSLSTAPTPEALSYLTQQRALSSQFIDALLSMDLLRFTQDALAFPLVTWDKSQNQLEYSGLQFNHYDGHKKNHPGSDVANGFFYIPGEPPYVIVEGILDACSVREAMSDRGVWAILSATSTKKLEQLKGLSLVLFLDRDAVGVKATQKATIILDGDCSVVDWTAAPEGAKDPNDLLKARRADLLRQMIQTTKPVPADKLKRQSASIDLKGFTAAEILEMELREPLWIVPGVIPEGLSLLAGKPKIGKSWLALDVATAVAFGTSVLGRLTTEPCEVLYLALEDNPRRMKERLLSVLSGVPASDRLHIYFEWPRMDRGGLANLETWLSDHKDTKLVIIDTMARVWPTQTARANSNCYTTDYDTVSRLKTIPDKFNIGLLLIHHLKKAETLDAVDQILGSSGIAGAVDTILILRRGRGVPDATLFMTGRDVEETEIAMRFDKDLTRWEVLGDATGYALTENRREIIEYLRVKGEPQTPKSIAADLGRKESTIRGLLRKMAMDGQVKARDGGYSIAR